MTLQKSKKSSRGRTPSGQPNPIDIHVGNRIRLRRSILGWSQEKLANMLGLTFQQVQKYERGSNRVGASRLWDIGNVMNVPINFFFEDMGANIASQSPRVFSSPEPEILRLEEIAEDIDMDPMKKQETLELVKAYYKINNRKTAKILFDLIVALSKSTAMQKIPDKK